MPQRVSSPSTTLMQHQSMPGVFPCASTTLRAIVYIGTELSATATSGVNQTPRHATPRHATPRHASYPPTWRINNGRAISAVTLRANDTFAAASSPTTASVDTSQRQHNQGVNTSRCQHIKVSTHQGVVAVSVSTMRRTATLRHCTNTSTHQHSTACQQINRLTSTPPHHHRRRNTRVNTSTHQHKAATSTASETSTT